MTALLQGFLFSLRTVDPNEGPLERKNNGEMKEPRIEKKITHPPRVVFSTKNSGFRLNGGV